MHDEITLMKSAYESLWFRFEPRTDEIHLSFTTRLQIPYVYSRERVSFLQVMIHKNNKKDNTERYGI